MAKPSDPKDDARAHLTYPNRRGHLVRPKVDEIAAEDTKVESVKDERQAKISQADRGPGKHVNQKETIAKSRHSHGHVKGESVESIHQPRRCPPLVPCKAGFPYFGVLGSSLGWSIFRRMRPLMTE